MITHLESDILECEVKWALGSITMNKASRGDGWNSSWAISNPKRWCCESAAINMPANLENSAVATGLEKVSFHSSSKERQCQRMLKNYCTIALISHTSKVMLKILQPGFSNMRTMNFLMFKLQTICQQIWKTQQWPQDWKMSVFIPMPKKGNAKECSNYRTIALISRAS